MGIVYWILYFHIILLHSVTEQHLNEKILYESLLEVCFEFYIWRNKKKNLNELYIYNITNTLLYILLCIINSATFIFLHYE